MSKKPDPLRDFKPIEDMKDKNGDPIRFSEWTPPPHQHTYNVISKWDHHASRYTGILDYSEALEVMCSGCLERKTLEETT